MAILKHIDMMLLAQLLERLPGLSDTAGRHTVMIEIGLDPNKFTIDQGSVHEFAVRFVYELNRQGPKEALQTMVTMLSDRLEGYQDDLAKLKEGLEILPASITASATPVPAVPGKSTAAPAEKGVAGLSQTLNSPDRSVSRYDFFIAYATPDRRQAQDLCWFLQDDSCEVFLDVQDLGLGVSWQPALREALEVSRAIVVLVSTHADDAFYQQEEIGRAIQLARDKPRAHTVIPVILEKLPQGAVSMPYGMSSLQARDATRSGGLKRVAAELVAWLKEHQLNAKQPKVADAMIEAILPTDEKEEIIEERDGNREGKSEVQAAIAEFKGVLHTVRGQIDGVCTYKELHEQLHQLQFLHNVIVDAARNFPKNKTDQDSLKECDIRLEGMVADLQKVVQQPLLASENAWIQTLHQAQKELHDAIEHAKAVQLKRAIRSIDNELAIRPSMINRSLTTAARQLSMTALDDAMAHLAPEQVHQWESKVTELGVLNHELIALIDEHATWQEVDIVLRRIAGNMQEILDEIELSWPDLKSKTEPLYRNGTEDWAQQFREESERLEHSLTIKDPNNVRSSFRSYRSRAEVRFFAVDKKLKDQCTSMSKIGTQLLGMME